MVGFPLPVDLVPLLAAYPLSIATEAANSVTTTIRIALRIFLISRYHHCELATAASHGSTNPSAKQIFQHLCVERAAR
jgi:hypothetical protein